ncbi:glutamine synthetase family protein [Halocatena halophila]|uniref:glutamine synthetase family protein n=1 Tax=Halocatena halophila TaxID=2814576 RepID=UPI002ED0F41F
MTKLDRSCESLPVDIDLLRLLFVTPNGVVRAESIAGAEVAAAISDGVEIAERVHWQTALGDTVPDAPNRTLSLQPAVQTFRQLPFASNCGGLVCTVRLPDGTPWPGDPRRVLRRYAHTVTERGLRPTVALESEFHLIRDESDDDAHHEESIPLTSHEFVTAVRSSLDRQGISVAEYRPEWGTDEHVLCLGREPALGAADQQVFAEETIHSIAANRGFSATMLPYPTKTATNGCRIRLSLGDESNDRFVSSGRPSRLAHAFLAGVLDHAHGLLGLTTGTVNSYARFHPAGDGPTHVCWSRDDRRALIRLPAQLPSDSTTLELEFRGADPTMNPYLAIVGLLRAGIDGIERNLTPPPPIDAPHNTGRDSETAPGDRLPATMIEALTALESDPILTDVLGETLTDCYLAVKHRQWQAFTEATARWERERFSRVY